MSAKNGFAHLELWTAGGSKRGDKKRWSARQILEEMGRVDGSCSHIDRPEVPIQLLGVAPMELADELDKLSVGLKDSCGRSTSSRARVLCVAVFSYPTPRSEASQAAEESWAADALRFARKFFGHDNIKSAVAHTDEKHFHLHVAVVPPRFGDRLAWEKVHPGLAAEYGVKTVGGSKKEIRKEYFNALRSFQDAYFRDVAVKHGQSRTGPRRRRLTREEWHSERRVLKLLEQAAGRPLEDVLSAAHWQERFEKSEKEKAAAVRRAEAAEQQAAKLKSQVRRLLGWLKPYVKTRVRRPVKVLASAPSSIPSFKQVERGYVPQFQKRKVAVP